MRRDGDQELTVTFSVIRGEEDVEDFLADDELRHRLDKKIKREAMRRKNPVPDGMMIDGATIRFTHEVIPVSPDLYPSLSKKDVWKVNVTATMIARTPTRGEVLPSWVDCLAYRSGASFRMATGGLIVNSGGALMTIDPITHEPGDDITPMIPLWEPVIDMTVEEVNQADYRVEDGFPARVRVAVDDNIQTGLIGGAL
jgi:hypothetical protein